MTTDKLKQYIGLFGGLLGAILLFLQSLGVTFTWFTNNTIDAFINAALASVPFIFVIYGVWKNSYITPKAKVQEEVLKRNGLK